MGEVRSTIEAPTKQSPKVKAQELIDQLHDLVTIKENDLKVEKGQETKNRESIAVLRTAIFHAQEVKKQLGDY